MGVRTIAFATWCCGQRDPDRFLDRIDVLQHLVIEKAKHAKSMRLDAASPLFVPCCHLHVLTAVDLDDQSGLDADKIRDVSIDRMLSAEFHAAELAHAQMSP
jgi:hypothetical protein